MAEMRQPSPHGNSPGNCLTPYITSGTQSPPGWGSSTTHTHTDTHTYSITSQHRHTYVERHHTTHTHTHTHTHTRVQVPGFSETAEVGKWSQPHHWLSWLFRPPRLTWAPTTSLLSLFLTLSSPWQLMRAAPYIIQRHHIYSTHSRQHSSPLVKKWGFRLLLLPRALFSLRNHRQGYTSGLTAGLTMSSSSLHLAISWLKKNLNSFNSTLFTSSEIWKSRIL